MNIDEANKALKQGAIASFTSAGITLSLAVASMWFDFEGGLRLIGPEYILDAALGIGLGVGLLRRSRFAAVTLFVYFIIGKIYFSIQLGKPIGIGLGLLFLYFFWRGIEGSFSYHKLRRETDSSYRPARKWSYFLGIPVAMALALMSGWALMMASGALPSARVIDGSKLRLSDSSFLTSENVVQHGEKVQLFYSTGLLSIRNDGVILTDKRIIKYVRIDGELDISTMPIKSIVAVEKVVDGDFLNDTIIGIWKDEDDFGDGLPLFLSAEDNGDELFLDEIKKLVKKNQSGDN